MVIWAWLKSGQPCFLLYSLIPHVLTTNTVWQCIVLVFVYIFLYWKMSLCQQNLHNSSHCMNFIFTLCCMSQYQCYCWTDDNIVIGLTGLRTSTGLSLISILCNSEYRGKHAWILLSNFPNFSERGEKNT